MLILCFAALWRRGLTLRSATRNARLPPRRGSLPELGAGSWAALRFLDLSRNGLVGSIPDTWGSIGMFSLVSTPCPVA